MAAAIPVLASTAATTAMTAAEIAAATQAAQVAQVAQAAQVAEAAQAAQVAQTATQGGGLANMMGQTGGQTVGANAVPMAPSGQPGFWNQFNSTMGGGGGGGGMQSPGMRGGGGGGGRIQAPGEYGAANAPYTQHPAPGSNMEPGGAAQGDWREKLGEYSKMGVGGAQQGLAAMSNQTRDIMYPQRSTNPWGPNLNPGLAGMMRQLDASNRGGFGHGIGRGR